MPLTRDQLVAWAAGFIDGEGSIFIAVSKRPMQLPQYSLRLAAGQVDPEPLLRLRAMWGGGAMTFTASRGKGRADSYLWYIAGTRAIKACRELLPFLTVKKRQAELALEYAALAHSTGEKIRASDIAEREEYRKLFSAMNKTGVSKPIGETKQRPVKKAHPQLRLLETS